MSTGQFDAWYRGAPILDVANSGDFGSWVRGAPVLQVGVVAPTVLDRLGAVPVEFARALIRDGYIPLEHLGALLRDGSIPVEMLGTLLRDGQIPLEHLGTLVRDGQIPVEVLGALGRLGILPVEFVGAPLFTLSRSGALPVEFGQGIVPFLFANWLGGGGGAPVWWPTTLYSYYPQQPLFKPGDKPAKHLRSRRRARHRARRLPQEARSDDYDAIVRALYRSFMAPVPHLLSVPVHPRVVAMATREQRPAIVPVADTFVQALREDAELLELELL